MESHLFYFSWCNDYTNDFADCSIWQRKVQFMEESWRALEINFAYIWLYLVTELPSHLVISLMPNAAYAKLQLLPKFKKVNLTFPIHVDIRENIYQILMLMKYIHKTFLFPRMQGRETSGLMQFLITSSIETSRETRRVNTAITHIHILMTHCLFTQRRPSSSQYS